MKFLLCNLHYGMKKEKNKVTRYPVLYRLIGANEWGGLTDQGSDSTSKGIKVYKQD